MPGAVCEKMERWIMIMVTLVLVVLVFSGDEGKFASEILHQHCSTTEESIVSFPAVFKLQGGGERSYEIKSHRFHNIILSCRPKREPTSVSKNLLACC